MCRWLTYCGDPIYLDRVIFERENSLIRQSIQARHSKVTTNGDGFGIGWYAERNVPGTYRDILPAWNDDNLRSITHQIRSGLFMAHVRSATGTATSRDNCHPFRHGKWLFMHNGQVGGYAQVRRKLESMVADRYFAHRSGSTDSELVFYLMFSEGLDRDPPGAVVRALRQVMTAMRECGITDPLRFTAAFTDGHRLYAVRFATDDSPPSLFWREGDQHVLVVSEPLDDDHQDWREVAPGQLLMTERHASLDMQPLHL